MSRIADALKKVHPEEPWRQVAPAAVTEAAVDPLLTEMGLPREPEQPDLRQAYLAPVEDTRWPAEAPRDRPTVVEPRKDARQPDAEPTAAAVAEPDAVRFVPVNVAFDTPLKSRLIIAPGSDPVAVEQYRNLAVTLHQAQSERQLKVVMVTGAMPGDGKTLTATNLALTLSGSLKRRVLLIDADLRRPALHQVFDVPRMSGLHEALSGPSDRKLEVLQPTRHLSVLLAGGPDSNPVGALSSDRMRRIIQDAAAHFDWVILDSPPAAMLPDVNLLSMFVDGTLLVVRAGVTPFAAI